MLNLLYHHQSVIWSKCIQIIACFITSSISSFLWFACLLLFIVNVTFWHFSAFWTPIVTYWMLGLNWDVKDVYVILVFWKVFLIVVLQNDMLSKRTWMYSKLNKLVHAVAGQVGPQWKSLVMTFRVKYLCKLIEIWK